MQLANDHFLSAGSCHSNGLALVNGAKVVDLNNVLLNSVDVDAGQTDFGGAALLLELQQLDVGHGVDVVMVSGGLLS